jgi:hypothetical protein
MATWCNQLQILNAVIRFVAVLVMHMFVGTKWASTMLLHDGAMFKFMAPTCHNELHVATLADASPTFPRWRLCPDTCTLYSGLACARAVFPFTGGNTRRHFRELRTAVQTSTRNRAAFPLTIRWASVV